MNWGALLISYPILIFVFVNMSNFDTKKKKWTTADSQAAIVVCFIFPLLVAIGIGLVL